MISTIKMAFYTFLRGTAIFYGIFIGFPLLIVCFDTKFIVKNIFIARKLLYTMKDQMSFRKRRWGH